MPARLFCQTGELAGSEFFIEQEAIIGRRKDNDITLPSGVVSSRHARIYYAADEGNYFLEDLKSYNGTKVNGLTVTSAVPLSHGHRITFAKQHVFIFETLSWDPSTRVAAKDPSDSTVLAADVYPPTAPSPPRQKTEPVRQSSKAGEPSTASCTWLDDNVIQSIVAHDNLVVRNLQVTQGYYRISEGMQLMLGDRNVSWCTFATHASKTAGQALRHELMPGLLKSAMMRMAGYDNTYFYLNEVLGHAHQPDLEAGKGRLAEAMRRVSLLVSEGNIIVFDELARPFVHFINTFAGDRRYNTRKLRAFLDAHFRHGPLERGGQDYLLEAFSAYYNARFETNPKRKAEYILQGNLLVGFHEQSRLQPQIEQALAVPLDLFRERDKLEEVALHGQRFTAKRLRQIVTRATTQMLMSITLPSRALKLTQDVIAPTGVDSFPTDLMGIEDPRCEVLVRQFEGRTDTLTGSAAEDWVSLQQRMRFVVDFFRSHQQYERLWEPPFLPNQMPAIEAGYLPAGPL